MVNVERPCCEALLPVELPLPSSLRCDECAVSWTVVDPEPEPAPVALAA